jgi:hypothetical protein
MNFSSALRLIKNGKTVGRKSWKFGRTLKMSANKKRFRFEDMFEGYNYESDSIEFESVMADDWEIY